VEKHLARALPKHQKTATSPELAAAFEKHTGETNQYIAALEQVFELLGEKATAKSAMQWLACLKKQTELSQIQIKEQ